VSLYLDVIHVREIQREIVRVVSITKHSLSITCSLLRRIVTKRDIVMVLFRIAELLLYLQTGQRSNDPDVRSVKQCCAKNKFMIKNVD
jgi:hypothetical protein